MLCISSLTMVLRNTVFFLREVYVYLKMKLREIEGCSYLFLIKNFIKCKYVTSEKGNRKKREKDLSNCKFQKSKTLKF